MGLSSLTRYALFLESANFINNGQGIIPFKDPYAVKDMYYQSAKLIKGFEDFINIDGEKPLPEIYWRLFDENAKDIQNSSVAWRIRELIQRQMNIRKNYQESNLPFETYFRYLIKAIADYQEEIIRYNFIKLSDMEFIRASRKQTFLSYAYYDKGLTQALFYYFWKRSGFLYVNWMWDGVNSLGSTTKKKLDEVLADSAQLLFLRTTNSELKVRGSNNTVRQWCAWEIGNFYTKHKEEKYYTSFYDRTEPRNDMLDTFRPMKDVVGGEIRC